MTVMVVRKSVNFFRLAGAFFIFSFCVFFAIIAECAIWIDEHLMKLAEKVAPH